MGDPKPPKFIYKKLCIYSYMFKFQSPSKYSPCDAIHLWWLFSTAENSFWPHQCWCLLVFSAVFCLTSSMLAKHFPLSTFFKFWETKITGSEWDQVNREVGHRDHAIFGQKWLNIQHSVGKCACKSPTMKWANEMKRSSKNLHWSLTQPLTTMPAGTHLEGKAYTNKRPAL